MALREEQRHQLLQAAVSIGRRLCREAWFDQEGLRCNWMGRQDIQDGLTAKYAVRSAAIGPELYGGSAGIALFLNELYRMTGDWAFGTTAHAAIRRSVQYMQRFPTGASPLSFFAGHLGMLYAACRAKAVDAMLELAGRYGESWEWPSGVNAGGPNPSLMIGTAGIGYHLLRLCDPVGIPSVLALTANPGGFGSPQGSG